MRTKGIRCKLSIGFVLALILSLQFSILTFADPVTTELKENSEPQEVIGTVTADESEADEVEDITVTGEGDSAAVNMDNVVLDEEGDSVSLSGTFKDGGPFETGSLEGGSSATVIDNGMHLNVTGTNELKELVVGTTTNNNPFILVVNVADTASTLLVNSLKVKDTWDFGTWESTRMTWDNRIDQDGFWEYINALFFKSVQPEERAAVAKIEEKHETAPEETHNHVDEYKEAIIPLETVGSVNGGSPLIVSDMDEQTKVSMSLSVLSYASEIGKEVQSVLMAKFVQAPIGFVEGQSNTIKMTVAGAVAGDNIVVAIYNPVTGKTEYIQATVLADGSVEFATAYMGYMTIFTVK